MEVYQPRCTAPQLHVMAQRETCAGLCMPAQGLGRVRKRKGGGRGGHSGEGGVQD